MTVSMPTLTLRVKVIPRAAVTGFAGELADGTLKLRVAAPPERGKANAAVIEFLAGHYRVPVSSVRIVSGHSASRKLVRIDR